MSSYLDKDLWSLSDNLIVYIWSINIICLSHHDDYDDDDDDDDDDDNDDDNDYDQ